MEILFLVRTLTYGGAERQLVALAKGLHARGHHVKVLVFYPGGGLEPDLRDAGIPILSVDKHGRWDIPRFFFRMARRMRQERPEIVHGYLVTSNILSLLFRPIHRGRAVWGVRASEMDIEHHDWLNRLDSALERRLSRFADLIIANSHAGRDHAVKTGFPATKTIVIPNGIDTGRFRPDPAGRVAVRAELGIAEDQVLIGRVGRLAPQKDYPTFLRAAAEIASRRPNARFVCVGAGSTELTAELKELAHQLGIADRVAWLGTRDDMPAVYSAMDLNVSSSVFGEGTPNAVAEAMACGVPCVVTDIGDSAITIGSLGAVVPAANPEALAEAVMAMLDAEIDRAALRAKVIRELSLESLIERSEAALTGLLPAPVRARPSAREAGS